MEILPIVAFGVVATVLLVVIRQTKPELAIVLSLDAGTILLLYFIPRIVEIFGLLQALAGRAGIRMDFLATLLKIMAIAYIAEFGAQISRDMGEGTLANKIELGGKILILLAAIPIIAAILQLVLKLLP